MPDLNDFANFHAVVTHGSLSAAARNLGVPKATVSKRLARLEADLEVRLLERSTRSLRLTVPGAAVFEQSETIVAGLEAAQAVARNATTEPNGLVRVSCPQGLMPNLVDDMLRRFLRAYPKVRLELIEVNRPVDLITEGIDLALRARTKLTDDFSLIMRRLGTSRRVVVASPDLAHELPSAMDLDVLSDVMTLALAEDGDRWDLVDDRGRTRSISVKPRLRCSDFHVMSRAALDGLGVAMLPDHLCQHKLQSGSLVRLFPRWRSGEAIIHAVMPSRRGMTSAIRALIEHLATEFASRDTRLTSDEDAAWRTIELPELIASGAGVTPPG
jgi:DNA-binding transcriptional LysR family regulator